MIEKKCLRSCLVKHVLPDPFFFKLKEFAELIVSDVIIAAFVIRFPDFTGQALCSATGHAGDILDIPVL